VSPQAGKTASGGKTKTQTRLRNMLKTRKSATERKTIRETRVFPQPVKPLNSPGLFGTTEVVPFHETIYETGS